jgi:hypothetical protein
MIALGDVPGWAAAAGTVGSFIAGFILLKQQGKQLSILRRQLEEQDVVNVRSQATKVSVWPLQVLPTGGPVADPDSGFPTSSPGDEQDVTIMIRNSSDETIWNLQAVAWSDWFARPLHYAFEPWQFVPPQQDVSFSVRVRVTGFPGVNHLLPPVAILFDDSSGLQWGRNARGHLIQFTDRRPNVETLNSSFNPWLLESHD